MRQASLPGYPVIGAAVAVARTVRVLMPRIGTRIPGRVTVTVTETWVGVAVTVPVSPTWARNAVAAAWAAAGSIRTSPSFRNAPRSSLSAPARAACWAMSGPWTVCRLGFMVTLLSRSVAQASRYGGSTESPVPSGAGLTRSPVPSVVEPGEVAARSFPLGVDPRVVAVLRETVQRLTDRVPPLRQVGAVGAVSRGARVPVDGLPPVHRDDGGV